MYVIFASACIFLTMAKLGPFLVIKLLVLSAGDANKMP